MKGKFVVYVYIVLCIIGIAFILSTTITFKETMDGGRTHDITNNRMLMSFFEITIQSIAEYNSDTEVPKNMKGLIDWIFRSNPYYAESFLLHYGEMLKERGVLHDTWGNPIKLVVKSSNEYILISFGPNGKDENGDSDDITYTFNPLGFRNRKVSN